MKELIRIIPSQIGNDTTPTCSARELHSFLEVGRDFTTWIKGRIERHGYVKGKDFEIVEFLSSTAGGSSKARPQISHDYIVTTDMGKELSMLEENGKGRLARRYFIHHEKRSVELVPLMAAELLRRNPLWQKIKRYKGMGLTMADIAKLVQRGVTTVRRHVREMERYGLLMPPVNLRRMQIAARQFRLPGMEVVA
jgi:phage anti-repressor protein